MSKTAPSILPLALEAALKHDQLVLLYQPQVTARRQEPWRGRGAGALGHPSLGASARLPSFRWLDSSGLIEPLGEWVLAQACKDARRWPGVGVSVNVSPLQFRRPNFVEEVAHIVAASGVPFSQMPTWKLSKPPFRRRRPCRNSTCENCAPIRR